MLDNGQAWDALTGHMAEVQRLAQVMSLLSWDQQTYLPSKGLQDRGAQAALISSLIQDRIADPRVGEWLSVLEAEPVADERRVAGLRNHRRMHDKAVKIPADLSARRARAGMEGYGAWMAAREARDFSVFAPALQILLDLNLEAASCVDPDRHPYDVLLDDYDHGTTVAQLQPMFARLREGLRPLIDGARAVAQPALSAEVPLADQRALHDEVLTAMGYDGSDGRMDDAVHPFTVCMGGGDVRITTHLYETDLLAGLGATMHEGGHALYELGIPRSELGNGVDTAASLGLHESQSRLWENFIGRSRPFLGWFAERLRERVPGCDVDGDALYRGANRIHPGHIRIHADEVTYNLHVIIRFELELALVEGRLAVADLPEAWNAAYRETLGVEVTNPVDGVLQDVHWSNGTIGYFPTYTLGNLYAAALGGALERTFPDLWDRVGRADLGEILSWLRQNVHVHGHARDGARIVADAAGEADLVDGLLDYLWARHGALLGLARR